MYEADAGGSFAVDPASAEYQLSRVSRPDHVEQLDDVLVAVGQAELDRRHGKPRRRRAITKIAQQSELEASAEAISVDHGDGRLGQFCKTFADRALKLVVVRDLRRR